MDIAELIRGYRARKRMTRKVLAEETGLCQLTIARIEDGKGFTSESLYVLAKALEIPMEEVGDSLKCNFMAFSRGD